MDFEILVLDDKLSDAQVVADILSELAQVKVTSVDDPEKAINLIERSPTRFALALIDFNLNIKNLDGLLFAKKVWEINSQQLIAIFSGEENIEVPIKCVGTPIVEFIKKGSPATLIQKKVQNLLKKYAATHQPLDVQKTISENEDMCSSVGLISKSNIMAEMAKALKKISASESATVLIRGESGSGKELVAKALHNQSRRKDQPFIAINMGAFQSTLIESELFGHEKGSFTGASNARKGAFVLADGGTIFLDEIGELPLDLQVKLLRVLQEKEVQPVGATKPVKINVRVIAATHVNLESQIAVGKFRFDLYQRLNVISLAIPPLRERLDDLGILVKHFLKKFNSKKSFHHSTLIQMEKYAWPGNVRELENVIQKLDILVEDEIIHPKHLPSEIFVAEVHDSSKPNFDHTMTYKGMIKYIQDLERQYYLYHLSKSKSVRDAALNRMDMPPSTLRDKMEQFEITFKNQNEIEKSTFELKGEENEQSI